MASFRFFDHTADLGIELQADSFFELLNQGALSLVAGSFGPESWSIDQGVFESIPDKNVSTQEVTWTSNETDPEWVLFDWLKHCLTMLHGEGRVLIGARLAPPKSSGLPEKITVISRAITIGDRVWNREIKAITLHDFRVWNEGETWHARLIVDI